MFEAGDQESVDAHLAFYLDSSNDHLVKIFIVWIYKEEFS